MIERRGHDASSLPRGAKRGGNEGRLVAWPGREDRGLCGVSLFIDKQKKGHDGRGPFDVSGCRSVQHSALSADLLGERDEDALRATDITEPIAVLVLHQLANQFGTVSAEAGNYIIDVFDGKHDATYAQRVRRALFGS